MERTKMKWGRNDLVLLLIGLIPLAVALLVYDRLPAQVPVHFGIHNNPNGYQSKSTAIVLFSVLSIGLPILMKVFRRIDPKRANYEKFEGAYEVFRFALAILMSCIFGNVLLYSLGILLDTNLVVMILMGMLFLVLGNYTVQVRYNFFFGIRTPWTLANEEVWRRTHRIVGPVYMGVGAIGLIGAFLPSSWVAGVFIVMIAIAVIVPLAVSYVMFRKIVG